MAEAKSIGQPLWELREAVISGGPEQGLRTAPRTTDGTNSGRLSKHRCEDKLTALRGRP